MLDKLTSLALEQSFLNEGFSTLVGIDEVGRGSLAGPVVAAACIIPQDLFFTGINDSKKLSSLQRARLFHEMTNHKAVIYGVGQVESEIIDEINILQATFLAMQRAVEALPIRPDCALIDGSMMPKKFPCAVRGIVLGDQQLQMIAAASILAKEVRDAKMRELAQIYPGYGFSEHVGYGTKKHLLAIEQLGPISGVHRRSFSPLKNLEQNHWIKGVI